MAPLVHRLLAVAVVVCAVACTPSRACLDSDNDGICNIDETDADADGCPDVLDPAPTTWSRARDGDGYGRDCDLCEGIDATGDADGDGQCNDIDYDDDNYGCWDAFDPEPTSYSHDDDGDSEGADCDLCIGRNGTGDIDGDGVCGDLDLDDDGDGCLDVVDPRPDFAGADDDGDGFANGCDLCVGDDRLGDLDGDGLCTDVDRDEDDDRCMDAVDLRPTLWTADADGDGASEDCGTCAAGGLPDLDGDGCCGATDLDADGDGCLDIHDAEPLRPGPDDNGDGRVDDCPVAAPELLQCVETCADGVDDDGDQLIDCDDPDCGVDPRCAEQDCRDGVDSDADGVVDCADTDCWGSHSCGPIVLLDAGDFEAEVWRRQGVHEVSITIHEPSGRVILPGGERCTWRVDAVHLAATLEPSGDPASATPVRDRPRLSPGCSADLDQVLPSSFGLDPAQLPHPKVYASWTPQSRNVDVVTLGVPWYQPDGGTVQLVDDAPGMRGHMAAPVLPDVRW
jgi:hypothetical protein